MKILLPVDGSAFTKQMLAYISAHDELLGPAHDYIVLTVVPSIPSHAARFLDRKVVDEYCTEQAEEVLAPIRKFVTQRGWKAQFVHAIGHAAQEVCKVADREKVSLVVMGTHGHSVLGNVVLGSVANGVLAGCKAPVLLIR